MYNPPCAHTYLRSLNFTTDVPAKHPDPTYTLSFLLHHIVHHSVPTNTPATTPPLPPFISSSSLDDSITLNTPNAFSGVSSHGRSGLVGLGFEGLEKGGGGTSDGLGRLSDGFRLSNSSSPDQDRSKAARTKPKKRHDVFFPCPHHSRSLSPVSFLARALPNTAMMQFRIHHRNDAGSPTSDMKADPIRNTVSTELKRAAGMERRASLSGCGRIGSSLVLKRALTVSSQLNCPSPVSPSQDSKPLEGRLSCS